MCDIYFKQYLFLRHHYTKVLKFGLAEGNFKTYIVSV